MPTIINKALNEFDIDIHVRATEGTVDTLKGLVKAILDFMGSTYSVDDVFEFKLEGETKGLTEADVLARIEKDFGLRLFSIKDFHPGITISSGVLDQDQYLAYFRSLNENNTNEEEGVAKDRRVIITPKINLPFTRSVAALLNKFPETYNIIISDGRVEWGQL
jgi:hypothetical protein